MKIIIYHKVVFRHDEYYSAAVGNYVVLPTKKMAEEMNRRLRISISIDWEITVDIIRLLTDKKKSTVIFYLIRLALMMSTLQFVEINTMLKDS